MDTGLAASCRTMWLAGAAPNNAIDTRIQARLAETLPRLKDMNLDAAWRRRFRTGLQFLVPSIAQALGYETPEALEDLAVLEIGCGYGPKSIGLAPLFRSYTGIDLNDEAITLGRDHASRIGETSNLTLRSLEADRVTDLLEDEGQGFDIFILYAVVEHLKIDERIRLLETIWRHLKPTGLLIVAELPNRLCPIDQHSSGLAFMDCLPDELALAYGQRSPLKWFRNQIYKSDDPALSLYRVGRGASHHEFELSIAPVAELNTLISGDAWSGTALNQFPVQFYERALQDMQSALAARSLAPALPSGFSRYWMEMALCKTSRQPLGRVRFGSVLQGHAAPRQPAGEIVYSTTSPVVIRVPDGARTASIGWRKESLASEVTVKTGTGRELLQIGGQTLAAAAGAHWSPCIYSTLDLGNDAELVLSSKAGDALVESPVFR